MQTQTKTRKSERPLQAEQFFQPVNQKAPPVPLKERFSESRPNFSWDKVENLELELTLTSEAIAEVNQTNLKKCQDLLLTIKNSA